MKPSKWEKYTGGKRKKRKKEEPKHMTQNLYHGKAADVIFRLNQQLKKKKEKKPLCYITVGCTGRSNVHGVGPSGNPADA